MTLHQCGKSVVIISKEQLSLSSAVAGGIYNPFNFRRTTPTWNAGAAVPTAKSFYTTAERITGRQFHASRDIVRIFSDEDERTRWKDYLTKQPHAFASEKIASEEIRKNINAPFGTGVVTGGGVINTGEFLFGVREYFSARNEYRDEIFHMELLDVQDDFVEYEGRIKAKKIVFARGHLDAENHFFPGRIIVPSKGETIHVSIPGLNLKETLNGLVYLTPMGDDLYSCGATFAPGKSDEQNTTSARQELLGKLEKMICLPYREESQFAGVRPAGRDRKPVLGISKANENVAIFNGFGGKGVLLAPYLAQLLVNHMENGAELPAEISLARFVQHK